MIFFITTKQRVMDRRTGEEKEFVFPFEAPVSSVEELTASLRKGPMNGKQLVYKHLPNGHRLITRRIGYTLTADSYDTIQESKWRFVEERS